MEPLRHLVVVPVVLPLVTAAVLVLLGERRRRARTLLSVGSTVAGLVVAVALLVRIETGTMPGSIGVYLGSNWEAPFGIVLVADRLAALMLVLVGVVSVCAALYAEAAWQRAGVHFHALFQIQLMGLCGAFLTGDLFNLFVFFEVMLAASYGLQLHGSGWPRVSSGLHYIAVNLLASALFLIGLAMLYGVTGTLSMADIAAKLSTVPAGDRGLLHAGTAILAVAFLIKAAMWPLNAWLVPAYAAASAPVAALFALMTKVGVYVLLRLSTLLFSDASPSPHFGAIVLFGGGLVTIAFAALGFMTTMRVGRIAGYSVLVSAGTLLSTFAMGDVDVTAAALYYLCSATLAVSALFLLVELVERIGVEVRPGVAAIDAEPDEDTNLDDAELPLVGRVFPVSIALLGLAFMVCALLVAGLPPLSGFLAKVALLRAVIGVEPGAQVGSVASPHAAWWIVGLLLGSGLLATISLSRAAVRHFWAIGGQLTSQIKVVEAIAVTALLAACVALTVFPEPVLRYTRATAAGLHAPEAYIEAVMSATSRPRITAAAATAEAAP